MPNFYHEKKLWKKWFKRVAGLDEAGRGPLAGPVVASAVVITTAKIKNQKPSFHLWKRGGRREQASLRSSKIKNTNQNLKLLKEAKDSKKLSPKKREELYKLITGNPSIKWGIGKVSEKLIDKINILEATKLAMKKAIKKLKSKIQNPKSKIDYLILDGNFKIDIKIPQKSIIKGDEKVFSCALASISAKVYRDRIMERYDKKYPRYGFSRHKGYPTKFHLKMLKKYGPCKIHRKSFKPVKKFLKKTIRFS